MIINVEVLKYQLDSTGIIMEHAENGQVAVDMFLERPKGYYDAILMDISMPVMDGLEAARIIRGLDRQDAKRIPIIAMTANAFDEDVQMALQSGMNVHLSKPVEPQHLYNTLYQLIRNKDAD